MSGVRSTRVPTNRRSRSSATVIPPPPRLSIPDEPPKVPRRPPSKGNKRETLADIAKRIPIQLMRLYFNYPLRAAAEAMHISVTTLKRLCRRHGVKRWPHRQISGINRALNDLEAQHQVAGNETDLSAVADQLRQLHRRREVIIELAFESDEESSRKTLNEDIPPAAHKRSQRSSASTDSLNPNTSTTAPAPHTRSESMDSTGSLDSAPESPGSATSLDESKPTSVWWQHTPVVGDSLAPVTCEDDKTKVKTKSGRARQPGSAASASSRGRAPRIQRASSDIGNMVRTGGRDPPVGLSRRKSSPGGLVSSGGGGPSTSAASIAIANGGSSAAGRKFPKGSSSSGQPFPSKRTSNNAGSRNVATSKVPAYMEMSVATAAAAAAAGRAGGNVFEQNTSVNQQMDDLAALGDLLFGPDDIAATADLKATGAHAGVFSPNASQWAPCTPFSVPEIFPQDQSLFGVSPSASLSTNDLGWGALVGDRNMVGMPTNVGLL